MSGCDAREALEYSAALGLGLPIGDVLVASSLVGWSCRLRSFA